MKKIFIFSILAFTGSTAITAAIAKPIYKNPPPTSLCRSSSEIGKGVEQCADNQVFVQAAKQCYEKLVEIRNQVTKELKKEIDSFSLQNQSASFDKSKRTYDESQAAHEYIFHVGQTALNELDSYFDEVVYPEHAESDEEILQTPCYGDAVVPLNEIAVEIKAIVVEAAGKAESADLNSASLTGHGTNLNSLVAPTDQGGTQSQEAAPKGRDIRKSDISGTKEKAPPKK
jgi:hypothetical protein